MEYMTTEENASDSQFKHSIKVPMQYKKAAKVLKNSMEGGASIKGQIFAEKHAKTNRLYALITKISKNKDTIDKLLERSQILEKESRLDKYLCYVLVTELIFGAKKLNGESKPVLCVSGYEERFKEILAEIENGETSGEAGNSRQDGAKPRYVRINTNKMSRAEALDSFVNDGWIEVKCETYDDFLNAIANLKDEEFVSDFHVNDLFVFPVSSKRYWALSSLAKESKIILQDKASCLPSFLLNPARGSTVLDMCAAPGMKTSHLACIMKNRGTIWAIERDRKRFETLSHFVNKNNCKIVKPINADILSIEPSDYEKVEYILLDPPCSGSGMTGRFNIFGDSKGNGGPDRLIQLATLQSKMLTFALKNFPNARKLIYSTCSINVEENEQVIQQALERCGDTDWKLVKPLEFAEKWKNFGSPKYKHIGKKCLYAKPEIDRTDGFFVAMFERQQHQQEES